MLLGTTYLFVVVVSSLDGRSAIQTVSVAPVFSGSTQLSLTTTFTKFNAGSKLAISGFLSADYPVTADWSVYNSLGVLMPITTLTPVTSSFSAADATSVIEFPLSIAAGVLTGGSVYSFRLSAHRTGDSVTQSFTQIVLTANSPPTGGYVSPEPTIGNALVTQFVISSPGWTSDASNYPLSFAFAYRLSVTSNYLTLAASSLRAFTTCTLPAGLVSQGNVLTLQGRAADIYGAFGAATGSVEVQFSATTNISHVLTTGLSSAFSSGNVNLAIQTVNNVSNSDIFSPVKNSLNLVYFLLINALFIAAILSLQREGWLISCFRHILPRYCSFIDI